MTESSVNTSSIFENSSFPINFPSAYAAYATNLSGIESFDLTPEEKINFIAGQYAQFSITKDDEKLSRIFTISSSQEKEYISFTTMISNSDYKQALNKLEINDEIDIGNLVGDFTIERTNKKKLFLLQAELE